MYTSGRRAYDAAMKQRIAASVAVALVFGVLVASCGSDEESAMEGGGTGGTATSGGSGGSPDSGVSGTGGTTGGSGGSGGGGTGGTGTMGGTGGTGMDGSAGMGTPMSDADCAAMTRAQECRRCCGDLHSDGGQAYDDAYTACVCTGATCGDQCSQSVCANPANPGPTPSCNDCLGTHTAEGAACDAATVEADCTDPSCGAYLACTSGCAG